MSSDCTDEGGPIGSEDYARVWLAKLNPDRLFITERIVLEKLTRLVGAVHSARALHRDWFEQCKQANEGLFVEVEGDPAADFRVTAEQLVRALSKERRAIQRRLSTVNRLLGR